MCDDFLPVWSSHWATFLAGAKAVIWQKKRRISMGWSWRTCSLGHRKLKTLIFLLLFYNVKFINLKYYKLKYYACLLKRILTYNYILFYYITMVWFGFVFILKKLYLFRLKRERKYHEKQRREMWRNNVGARMIWGSERLIQRREAIGTKKIDRGIESSSLQFAVWMDTIESLSGRLSSASGNGQQWCRVL